MHLACRGCKGTLACYASHYAPGCTCIQNAFSLQGMQRDFSLQADVLTVMLVQGTGVHMNAFSLQGMQRDFSLLCFVMLFVVHTALYRHKKGSGGKKEKILTTARELRRKKEKINFLASYILYIRV